MNEIIVVGAGFFGATFANLAAQDGKKVTVIEKRNHIGGNSYTEMNKETGIEIHKYGSHLFHTSNARVWEYLNHFSTFNDYQHHVWTKHLNKYYSLPINLDTINRFFKTDFTPEQASAFLKNKIHMNVEINNFEDKAISLIGRDLYEAFIKNYTKKQWQLDPKELPEEIISRLPVRYNYNSRYFSDKYEGIPIKGYTKIFEKMLDHENIELNLNIDFFDIKSNIDSKSIIIYTGPIDRYFNYEFGLLGWRTLDFKTEVIDVNDFQGTSVMNYADLDVEFTRIHEFKHLHPEREYINNKTIIMKEFSRFATENDEPYYPINSKSDREKLSKYRKLMREENNTIFGGRLGSYQYLDMHMAIASAFSKYNEYING
jgi:UDP-galactopyranose mutase